MLGRLIMPRLRNVRLLRLLDIGDGRCNAGGITCVYRTIWKSFNRSFSVRHNLPKVSENGADEEEDTFSQINTLQMCVGDLDFSIRCAFLLLGWTGLRSDLLLLCRS